MDLLLQLIEQEELDISEVSLAQVCDQYLKYLAQVEELNPAEVADWLVVAAKLLIIAFTFTRTSFGGEEESKELQEQLKLFKAYLEAGQKLINYGGRDKLNIFGKINYFRGIKTFFTTTVWFRYFNFRTNFSENFGNFRTNY